MLTCVHGLRYCSVAGLAVALDELLNKYSGSLSKSYDTVSEFLAGYSNTNEEVRSWALSTLVTVVWQG